MKRLSTILPLLIALLGIPGSRAEAAAPQHVFKIATVMPQGGPWANALTRFAAEVKKATRGHVEFRFYFGAVAGTERRAVARMRAGQIQGVACVSAGISSIEPSIRVLELPLLFRSYKEFRYVLGAMAPVFAKRFQARGYQNLSIASVGWVYIYSKRALRSMRDVQSSKIWHWKHDPMPTALFKIIGVRGHPLPITDVLPSLQAGTIDTVYGMPHAAQALQWHTSLNHQLNLRVTMAIATVIVRQDAFARLSAEDQRIVRERAAAMERVINQSSQAVNAKAMRTMIAGGMTLSKPSDVMERQLRQIKTRVWDQVRDRLFKPEDLRKIQALLTTCRAGPCRR